MAWIFKFSNGGDLSQLYLFLQANFSPSTYLKKEFFDEGLGWFWLQNSLAEVPPILIIPSAVQSLFWRGAECIPSPTTPTPFVGCEPEAAPNVPEERLLEKCSRGRAT